MVQILERAERKVPEVAFVLSGGAALGASQVGMLRALLERGIKPDLVVGTSIGAWNGLWVAAHPDLASLEKLERIWNSITLNELLGANPINLVANLATKRPYLVTNDGMQRIFHRAAALGNFTDITFEQLPIPLKVTASNLMRGTTEVFDHGAVAPTILASSAIPGLFPPVLLNGQQYVDGGLLDNGGVGVAVAAGAKLIYVMSVMYGGESPAPITNLIDLLVRSTQLVAASHVHNAISRYAQIAEFVLIEDASSAKNSSLDFHHASQYFASGYSAAEQALEQQDKLWAARALLATPQASKSPTFFTHWLQQPTTKAALQAVARVDVALQKGWKQLNELVSLPHR